MEHPLSRTLSSENTQSWQHLTSTPSATAAARKARSSVSETGGSNVERASVSMPPLGSKAILHLPARRPSKASDNSLLDYFGSARNGSAIIDEDPTPALESVRSGPTPVNPLLLPDSFRHPRSDVDAAESKRLSISSIVSTLVSTRGYSWSGRSSLAGSEPEGVLYRRLAALLGTLD